MNLESRKLYLAKNDDYQTIRLLYHNIIDKTPHMNEFARWKKGLHPTDEAILDYIKEKAMYLYMEEDQVIGAFAVTMYQGEDYHSIDWDECAKDDEVAVIHLLGVSPEYQGKGMAKAMIYEAISLAKAENKKSVRLDALATNIPAQKMYTGIGFIYRGKQNLYAKNTGWADFYFYEYTL